MILLKKPDTVGILASSLCLIHCIVTPFLFLIQVHTFTNQMLTSKLWMSLDYVFLLMSYFAIYWSTKSTSKYWIKLAFWFNWFVLCLIILNEKIEYLNVGGYIIYFPSLGLVFLHIYNLKFRKCQNGSCAIDH